MDLMPNGGALTPFLRNGGYDADSTTERRIVMSRYFGKRRLSSFQIILRGFAAVILVGTLLLMLPVSSRAGCRTGVGDALFTAVSAVCVTGLVVRDTAMTWSAFGQAVILVLIQIGGLGIVSLATASASGRKISLLQRSVLQESISADQVGGIVQMTRFVVTAAFAAELLGAAAMMPAFCSEFGAEGIWMAVFHSVSAFCNAGFDIMGDKTGAFSSLTYFSGSAGIVFPVCLLIVIGGSGFLTWNDLAKNRFRWKRCRMQTKVVIVTSAVLIAVPAAVLFLRDYSSFPLKERICLSVFQAVTPRTAGFNTADMNSMTSAGRAVTVVLMLIGGSPGSTAGGIKTTTFAVLLANAAAVVRRRSSPQMFGRRIEDDTVKTAATLLTMYLFLALAGACVISAADGYPIEACLFEAVSAIGTVGLSMGITPLLGGLSRCVLIGLMFFGRVGGLTLMYAALGSTRAETGRCPAEKINVG